MVIVQLKDRKKVKILIAGAGKSLRDFSLETGVSHSYLSQILNGFKSPSPKVAKKIANGLGGSINDFFLIKVVDGLPLRGEIK